MKRMIFFQKEPLILIFLTVLILFSFSIPQKKTDDPFEYFKDREFKFQRGVNISHWLSQSNRRGEERRQFIKREDIVFIKNVGYDHIRIPIDEEQMWDEDGNKESEAFELLHNGIRWAAENQLRVVVDLHILRSHHFNRDEKPLWTEPEAQQRFFDLWKDLSEELKKYPTSMVAYELMNEPVADDPEEWNKLVEKALAVVRENEPERKVVIGSNRWQSVDTFNDLRIPEDDPHIILSFHFYHPFILTHYTASWTGIRDYNGKVNYPGLTVPKEDLQQLEGDLYDRIKDQQKYIFRDSLEAMMLQPIQKAAKYALPLYCGEWGCLPTVDPEDRMQWYKDMRYILEKNGIAWANWDYKGGFGIVDRDVEKPFREMIEVLVGEK